MGFSSANASARLLLLCLLVLTVCNNNARGSPLCLKYSLEDDILIQDNQCLSDGSQDYGLGDGITSRVSEVNGATLERALSLLQSQNDPYIAVLFYAEWCPFSRALRPMFDNISTAFPSIYHFAVEDSALRPSALSQYGVHSFPALFLHNKTVKVRYYGSRTVKAIGHFYEDVTGFQPISPSNIDTDGVTLMRNLSTMESLDTRKICPYPWAKSPEKWLHDDMYLALATMFLVLRLFFYLLPRIWTGIKYYWIQQEASRHAHKGLFRGALFHDAEQEQRVNRYIKTIKGKSSMKETIVEKKETGKGVLSVPGWSSSSLAAVTLAEASSSRGTSEETRENGNIYRSRWG